MKVVIVNEIGCDKINDYIFILLGLLGVKRENIVLLNETTQFKNVYVPRPSFDITAYYTKKFADMYNKIADSVDDDIKHEKIYLSRCKLPMKRHTYGEEKIQNVFKKNGFKIIYPETLPLEKQIALMKNCRVLAGCAGTALHLALFMKKGGTVIQIKRNTVLQDNADTQYVINTAKGLNSVFIWASVEKIKTNHFSDVAQIIGPTKYMKQFFDDNNFEYNEKDLSIDDKTWQEYTNALGDMSNEKRFINMLKKYFVHYTSCLIPGRMMRKKYRHFMNEKL